MTDRRRIGGEDFQITGIKNMTTSVASNNHVVSRPGDGLQQQFSREDAPVKATEYTLLQLINMVRENPVLYDEDLQSSTPDSQLKLQKREAWDRIRTDIVWQDITLIQDTWVDLLEQYARKPNELSDTLMDALRWTDSLINKKSLPVDSRPPSQMNPMSSALDKDFYNDVPLAEDVLEPGQNPGESSPSVKFDYVVIQPSVGHVRSNSHQTIQSNTTSYTRRRSPSPRETEAIVRTYPLSPKKINHRMPLPQDQRSLGQHNDGKEDATSSDYGRPGVLVEVESSSSYPNSNTKIYKMIRNSTPQTSAPSNKRVIQLPHRTASLRYDSMPDQIIESSSTSSEPPAKKKMTIEMPMIHQSSQIVLSNSSDMVEHLPENSIDSGKLISECVPMADDEIILETEDSGLTECKIDPSGLIIDPSLPSTSQGHGIEDMSGQQDDGMHHYHHEDIEETEVVVEEEIEQQTIHNGGNDLTMQYDEDLQFQQHINSVLNRLADDDKSIVKFQMQRIILDARFGEGSARNLLKEGDNFMLGVQSHVEIEPEHVEAQDQM